MPKNSSEVNTEIRRGCRATPASCTARVLQVEPCASRGYGAEHKRRFRCKLRDPVQQCHSRVRTCAGRTGQTSCQGVRRCRHGLSSAQAATELAENHSSSMTSPLMRMLASCGCDKRAIVVEPSKATMQQSRRLFPSTVLTKHQPQFASPLPVSRC